MKKKEPVKKKKDTKDELKHTPAKPVEGADKVDDFKKVAGEKTDGSPEIMPEKKKRRRRTRAEIEAEKDKLAEEPNPLLFPIVEIPFTAWASGVGDERFKLSEDERYTISLSLTQLMEYYFPKAKSIYFAWFTLLFQTYQCFNVRQNLIREIRKSRGLDPRTGKKVVPGDGKPPEKSGNKDGYHDDTIGE